MKKKYIVISVSIIFLISLIAIIYKNEQKYIIQDGVMLALTLDGEKIDSYPTGTNYTVNLTCENGKGKWLVDEWKLVVEEVTGNVVCNIEFISNPKTLISEVESKTAIKSSTYGYRYTGKTPENYIWFNNEMWRIIGSIPTCLSASCGSNTTNLVKIIRNDSIGGLTYNASGGSGAWGGNTLYTLLNSYYYGAQDATGTSYCYGYQTSGFAKCNYTNIGIVGDSYYGKMIKNVYWNTGSTILDDVNYSVFNSEKSVQTKNGYIGIMNLSDYLYATLTEHSTSGAYFYGNAASNCWLFVQGNEWTMAQNVSYSGNINIISNDGRVGSMAVNMGYATRPVVYLDPSVYIISGDGSITNPYQIGM